MTRVCSPLSKRKAACPKKVRLRDMIQLRVGLARSGGVGPKRSAESFTLNDPGSENSVKLSMRETRCTAARGLVVAIAALILAAGCDIDTLRIRVCPDGLAVRVSTAPDAEFSWSASCGVTVLIPPTPLEPGPWIESSTCCELSST